MELQAAIIGPGWVGLALASKLQGVNFATGLIGRSGPVERSWTIGDTNFISPKRSDGWLEETRIAFLTTKAYDLEQAMSLHLSRLNQNCVVIPLCNGYIADVVRRWRDQNPKYGWRLGSVDIGVKGEGKRLVLSNPSGRLLWGSLFGETQTPIEQALKSDFFQWAESIEPICRRKWLFNTAINSLAASLNLEKNGLLLQHEDRLRIVFDEVWRLGESLWGTWPFAKVETWNELLRLVDLTGENENSMRRDKRLHRKTESQFLAGLAKQGFPELEALHRHLSA